MAVFAVEWGHIYFIVQHMAAIELDKCRYSISNQTLGKRLQVQAVAK